jgi:hypothetical protein
MAPNKKKNKKKAAATNGTSTPTTASAAGDITATSATTASSNHDAGVSILAAPAASSTSPTPPVDLSSLNLSGRMDQLTIQVDSQNHQNVAAAVVAAVTPQLQRRQHAFWDTQVRAIL